jgi:hypothetical protein
MLARKDSFAWKLLLGLANERREADQHAQESKNWLSQGVRQMRPMSLGNTTPGSLRAALLVALGVVALVVLGLSLIRSGVSGAINNLPNQQSLIGDGILVWLGVAIPIWFAYERAHAAAILAKRQEEIKEQRWDSKIQMDRGYHGLLYIEFSSGILSPLPWIIGSALLIDWLRNVLPTAGAALIPSQWLIWTIAILIYAGLLFGATYRYYAGVSRLRGEITRVRWEAMGHRDRYVHATRERERLAVLHQVIPKFFESIALPMHQPWIVDDSVVLDGVIEPEVDRFPACVGLANASRIEGQTNPRMRTLSRAALVTPGWLSRAVNDVIVEISHDTGVVMDIQALDSDSGESRGGARSLTIEHASDPLILSRIGRRRLRDLAALVQIAAVKEVKPNVRPMRDDGLGELVRGTSRLRDEHAGTVPWSDFLETALAPAAPFSLLTFKESSRSATPQNIDKTVAIVPADMAATARARGYDVIEVEDDGPSPLDLVVRIDRSAWLEPTVLTILDETSTRDLSTSTANEIADLPPAPSFGS